MAKRHDKVVEVPIEECYPGDNDRTEFLEADLLDLAGSINTSGLAQPSTVRPKPGPNGQKYQIVAGERRWRACGLASEKVLSGEWAQTDKFNPGLIPVIIRELSDEEADTIMLLENSQRVDLKPLDEARAYKKRMDRYGWSIAQTARKVKKPAKRVRDLVTLLELIPEVQRLVEKEVLHPAWAVELAPLSTEYQRQAIEWMSRQKGYRFSQDMLSRYVQALLAQQQQVTMFDDLFNGDIQKVVEMPGYFRHNFPKLAHLPELPHTKGKIGDVIDQYIAHLIQLGHHDEAKVLLDFWRKLMKSNFATIQPWGCKTLPLIQKDPQYQSGLGPKVKENGRG
ncbi:MAG: Nucleoid occlusion protein [Anaerolineae bacterium]|nr:Nucleoid occlusion protein [Anaerolineae bacterium]